jgi:predicted N-formylglutamate amidohydrolase
VRQDLVRDESGARQWAGILADALTGVLGDENLYQRWQDPASGVAAP